VGRDLTASHLRASSPDLSTGTRIDLDDIAKRYVVGETTVTALTDVNLHVDETAFVVVLGPSGSGKTTLLNMIGSWTLPPRAGSPSTAGT
jgi:putative ABC transport system ATP-binding protein